MIPCKGLKYNNSNYCPYHFELPEKVNMNNAYYFFYFNKFLYEDIMNEHVLLLISNNCLCKHKIFYYILFDGHSDFKINDFINCI